MTTPKALAKQLAKNMRHNSKHLVNRVLAPNLYRVQMPPEFIDHWWALLGKLEHEMTEYLNEAIERSGYLELTAPVRVELSESQDPGIRRPLIMSSFERPRKEPALLLTLAGMSPSNPYPLDKPVTVLGRGEADIKLPEDRTGISRQHARIYGPEQGFVIQEPPRGQKPDPAFVIEDMNSMSGTFVNQCAVKEAQLKSGDIISIGDITWRFELEKGMDDVCIS